VIELKNVHMVFNPGSNIENHALTGLSCRVETGQFVTVIGSNGAGKSTFLNVVAGELTPTAGSVVIDGKDVTTQSSHQRAGLVARVFQDPLAGTCDALTIEENLALAGRRGQRRGLGWATGRGARGKYRELLAQLELGLENRLNDRIGLLSGGQRQAVSLLMATLADVSVLLLDEHTAALDPRTADFVMRTTESIVGRTRPTTIMITHSMKQALDYGTRTLMLHAGRIALDVSGEERTTLGVSGLLAMFSTAAKAEVDSDALLLAG
jgi:putative ABC transport system ATP-binding protein